MNTRIEQLTRTYLDSLILPYYLLRDLDGKKQRIIKINSQTGWIIFNAGSLKAKKLNVDSRVPLLKVDENNRVVSGTHREGYGLHIERWVERFGDRIGLAGEYFLGNSQSPTGEMEEELSEDGYNTLIGYRKTVWGCTRKHDGTLSSVPVPLNIWREEVDLGFSPESYDITESLLKQICKESLKIYYRTNNDPDSLDADRFNFFGGDSITGTDSTMYHHLGKLPAVPVDHLGKGEKSYWIAVKKEEMAKNGYEHDESTVILNRAHWKKERDLDNLLNDNEIVNSRERSVSDSNSSSNSAADNFSPPHTHTHTDTYEEQEEQDQPQTSPPSTAQTIQFKIKSIERNYDDGFDLFDIEADSPISINGRQVVFIDIMGRKARSAFQNGDLQPGNTIAITNIRFAPNRASINHHNELWIGKSYDEIQVVSSANPSSDSPAADSPPLPTFFPEVGQINQELNQEENKMVLLAEELLKVIEDNNQICQEAQSLKLNLPEIPTDALNYFQEEFFEKLDESQPLNSSHNSQINVQNGNIRNKKLNTKKNIYGIYESNKKKLAEGKSGQKLPPANALEKLKQETKERISKILTDKDNLRNINLTTLANGKYQNWEKDIERLTTEKEVLAYVEAFVKVLKETGAEEKEKEQKGKNKNNENNPDNSQNSPENSFIDNSVKRAINNLPLPTAKNLAKNKIRELFKKYHPDLEKIKGVWEGEKSWMSYLEKCTSSEEVLAFMEKLEKAIVQQSQKSQGNDKKNPTPQESWILPLVIIGLVVVIGLAIIIKLLYKRKKVVN